MKLKDEFTFANTPNVLTLVRVGFIPLMVGCLYLGTPEYDILAAVIFGFAGFTDFLDGYLARKYGDITVYGKLLDPLADKFLVVAAVVMLQHLDRMHPIIVMILICRELGITGLRALASAEGIIIPASASAKWKTATQMVALPCMMIKPGFLGIPFYSLGVILLYISLFISLWSAKDYFIDFLKGLRRKKKPLP